MSSSRNKTLLNNTFVFMIGSIGSKFIQFFLVPLYTYTLTTEEFGVTELVLTAAGLLQPLFSMSIADGLLRFGLDKNLSKEQVKRCALILTFIGTLLSFILIPLFQLERTINRWIFFFLAIMTARIYRDIFAINLKIYDKNKLFAIDSILYTFELCICSFIFLVPLKMGIEGYFWANIVANVLSALFLIVAGTPFKGVFSIKTDYKLLKEIAIYSLPMIINGLSWWIANSSNRFMISYFMTDSDVGIYSVASKIPLFISTFTGVFCQAWIISAVVEFDSEQNKQFYSTTFNRYAFVLLFFSSLLIAIVQPFMHLYVSQEFEIAWRYTPFLILSTVFSSIAAFYAGIYAAAKKNINVMFTTLLGAFLNIGLNYWLIPHIGVMGAAIATMLSWGAIFVIRYFDVQHFFSFSIDKKMLALASSLVLAEGILIIYGGNLGFVISIIIITLLCYVFKNYFKEIKDKVMRILKTSLGGVKKNLRKLLRVPKNKRDREKLLNKDFTIIASNCTAGILYHELRLKFLSPTINLYMEGSDFVKFCTRIHYYLNVEMSQVEQTEKKYPVVRLDDITLYCVHYNSFEEVKQKWNERKKRICWDNVFFMMAMRDGATQQDVEAFDKLPYKNKVVFVNKPMPQLKSAYFIPNTALSTKEGAWHSVEALTTFKGSFTGLRYIDDFDFVRFFNEGQWWSK